MLRKLTKLQQLGVKSISINSSKKSTETLNVPKKNLGSVENIDVKPQEWDEALPFESIPGPKPLPIIGNIWRFFPYVGEYYNVPLKDLYNSINVKYGNIVLFRGIPGRPNCVILFDVNDMEKTLRNEGPFPIRRGTDSLKHYRTVTRKDFFSTDGVITLQGEEWFNFRSVVNPILMQPRTAQQYVGNMDKVASQFVENIRYFSEKNKNNEMPDDFQNEIYKWSLESIGVIAVNKHLGCLNLNAPKDSEPQKLIKNVNEMLNIMYELDVLPPIWKIIQTPAWKKYVVVMDFITKTTMKYIDEALNKAIEEDTPENKLSVIQRLAKIDKQIAVVMAMDLLTAGIDTTGKTLAAALYFLAKNPDKQQQLRDEAFRKLPENKSPVTKDILNDSPYLKAVIKETTRISPIAIGNQRTSVKDMVLGGYKVPKNTEVLCMQIITSNSEMFKNHNKFIPERWLRTTEDDYSYKNVHPFAYMPFGFGPRSCVGKRLANLELEVGLLKIIRNFELSWHHEDMIFSGKFLYGPESPLKLRVKSLDA